MAQYTSVKFRTLRDSDTALEGDLPFFTVTIPVFGEVTTDLDNLIWAEIDRVCGLLAWALPTLYEVQAD